MTLISHCDKAYERANLSPPRLRNAANLAHASTQHEEASPLSSTINPQTEAHTVEKKPADETACDLGEAIVAQDLPDEQAAEPAATIAQQTPVKTWASVVRSAPPTASSLVKVAQNRPIAMSTEPVLSPAQRLAARIGSTKAADNDNGSNEKGIWVGRRRNSRDSTVSVATARGRSGSESTVRAGSTGKPSGLMSSATSSTEAGFPKEHDGKGADLDLDSASDFPLLSPVSTRIRSPSAADNILPPVTASWAQIVGSTSVKRSSSSSTSDPSAVSDAGTVSTSISSIDSDLLDPISLVTPALPKMGLTHGSGAKKTIRAKKPAPINTKATNVSDTPRKPLPAEWTQALSTRPENDLSTLSSPKSAGNIRKLSKSAHDASPTAPKSPTKTIPFELATARRAAEREKKEKAASTSKIVPAVPKTLTKGKSSAKTHSKTASSETSTTQYHTAELSPLPSSSSQSFATAPEEPHQTVSAPGSPSRIHRLATGSSHIGSTRTGDLERSPVRAEVRVEATVSEMFGPHQKGVSRARSQSDPQTVDIGDQDISLETVRPYELSGSPAYHCVKDDTSFVDARSEMAKSDDAIHMASDNLEEILHMEHTEPCIHFEAALERDGGSQGLGILSGTGSSKMKGSTTASVLDPSGEDADVESLQSSTDIGTEEAQGEGIRSPETVSTWPETSDISVSHGSDFDGPACNVGRPQRGITSDTTLKKPISRDATAKSEATPIEGQKSALSGPRWSLHPDERTPNSSASTIRGSNISRSGNFVQSSSATCLDKNKPGHPAYGRGTDVPKPFQGSATTSSKLNAQAREFVPSATIYRQSGNTYNPPSNHGCNRSQMPSEWMHLNAGSSNSGADQPAIQQDISHSSHIGEHMESGLHGKKYRKKRSPKKSDSIDRWDYRSGEHTSTYHQGPSTTEANPGRPSFFSEPTAASEVNVGAPSSAGGPIAVARGSNSALSDTAAGPSTIIELPYAPSPGLAGGPPVVGPNMFALPCYTTHAIPMTPEYYETLSGVYNPERFISQGSRSHGYLQEVTNLPHGQHRDNTANEARSQPYLGRGGAGIPTDQIPKGDHPFEKWWHEPYTSTNGGPLTMGSWYDYLKQSGGEERARELYPTIFPKERDPDDDGLRAPNENGDRLLKSCGNVEILGAYEAMPHYPLSCPKCEPDRHPDMARMGNDSDYGFASIRHQM